MKKRRFDVRRLFARLHRDEGGNVLVIYVAGSLLLVAMVWAIIGTGARAVQHETIQSSADAAAFSASVIKAKGLNIIAFCNLVMALLLALVMLLRAIKYALYGIAALISICAAVPVIFNPLEPFCLAVTDEVDTFAFETYPNLEDKAEQFIKKAMKGLNVTERAVAKLTPILAFVESYHIGTAKAYQDNFGKGTLVTVSWPLPTEKLPVKDGTCDDLANNAKQYIHDIAQYIIDKLLGVLHIPSAISGFIADGIQAIISPVAGTLCGGTGSIDVVQKVTSTDCGECQSSSDVQLSDWIGNAGVTEGNVIGGKFKTPDEKGATCQMKGMPGWSCNKNASEHICSGENPARVWNWMEFKDCVIKKKTKQQVTGESDWPLPLVFEDGWDKKVNTRAFTVLTDAAVDERRQSVGIAAKGGAGTSPALAQMMAMAQAEWMAWNGNADLWHMDWRARLVPFTFGDTSGGADAGDVPAGSASMISKIISDFKGKSGTSSLSSQFLLH